MLECRCRQQGLGYDQCTLAKAACATETESTPTLPDASAGPEEKHKGFIGHIQARQPSYNPKKNRVIAPVINKVCWSAQRSTLPRTRSQQCSLTRGRESSGRPWLFSIVNVFMAKTKKIPGLNVFSIKTALYLLMLYVTITLLISKCHASCLYSE